MHAPSGRFTGADPITISGARLLDPQQQNLYAYVRNNPLGFIDPDGRQIVIFTWWPPEPNRPSDEQLAAEGERGIADLRAGRDSLEKATADFWAILDAMLGTEQLGAPENAETWTPREPTLNPYLIAGAAILVSKRLPGGRMAAESTALLTQAAMTVGNKGAIAASRDTALAVAEQWVGIGARLIRSRFGQALEKSVRTASESNAQRAWARPNRT